MICRRTCPQNFLRGARCSHHSRHQSSGRLDVPLSGGGRDLITLNRVCAKSTFIYTRGLKLRATSGPPGRPVRAVRQRRHPPPPSSVLFAGRTVSAATPSRCPRSVKVGCVWSAPEMTVRPLIYTKVNSILNSDWKYLTLRHE